MVWVWFFAPTPPTTQYPFCGLSPDVFPLICLQHVCRTWNVCIRFCTVTSRQVFSMKLCMHCRGKLCHSFYTQACLSLSFPWTSGGENGSKMIQMATQRFQNGAVGTPRWLSGGPFSLKIDFGMDLGSIWDSIWDLLEVLERSWSPFEESWAPLEALLGRIFDLKIGSECGSADFLKYLLIFVRCSWYFQFFEMKFMSSHLLSCKCQSSKSLHIFSLSCAARGFSA